MADGETDGNTHCTPDGIPFSFFSFFRKADIPHIKVEISLSWSEDIMVFFFSFLVISNLERKEEKYYDRRKKNSGFWRKNQWC